MIALLTRPSSRVGKCPECQGSGLDPSGDYACEYCGGDGTNGKPPDRQGHVVDPLPYMSLRTTPAGGSA